MRPKSTLLCLLLLAYLSSFSAPVTISDARKTAASFIGSTKVLTGFTILDNSTIIIKSDSDGVLIYAFNLHPEGFILISAEDACYPVLAYSTESSYSSSDQPDNFVAWLKGYADQIQYARRNNAAPDYRTSETWNELINGNAHIQTDGSVLSVSPLLTSTWNQGAPYNYLCPADPGGSGGHVYAGCVATAMAQVAYYWRWPLQGTGSHGYYSSYGYLFADYGNTAYDWEAMTNAAVGRNFEMANIQYHMGIGVDMMYGPNGSGAYSDDAAQALISYFGMSPSLHLEYAPSPIDEAWKSLLRSELDAGRPMYYHGFGTGGHAFNLDGYQGTDYFHFNWGWGGSFNGYYYLNNLNPGGNSFTEGQGAIIGISPVGNYPYYCSSTDTLRNLNGTIEDGSGPVADYPGNLNCGWLIMPDDSIVSIQLTFHRFDLEENYDFLTVYAGADTTAPIVGVFTGTDAPQQISSDSDALFIKFTTNGSGNEGGWFASYSVTRATFCSGLTVHTGTEGAIDDGSGTFNYHENTLCKFKIMPEDARSIVLSFNEFDTFDDEDFLMIFNLENNDLLYTLSGSQNPGTLNFNTGKLLLMFRSNSVDNAQGWSLNYTSSPYTLLPELENSSFLLLYPNPAKEILNFAAIPDRSEYLIEIMNIHGGKIMEIHGSSSPGTKMQRLDISRLTEGVYFLRYISGSTTVTRKFMVSN